MTRRPVPARRAATVAALLAAGALGAAGASAQEGGSGVPARAKVLDLRAKVLDIERKVTSLGGAVSRVDSGKQVRVGLSADVLFAFDSARLSGRAARVLRDAALTVDRDAGGTVRVEGHTDAKGSPGFNRRLSRRRAEAVRKALSKLVERDVDFTVRGRGESDPVAPNRKSNGDDNPAGRRLNRRVEVRFTRR